MIAFYLKNELSLSSLVSQIYCSPSRSSTENNEQYCSLDWKDRVRQTVKKAFACLWYIFKRTKCSCQLIGSERFYSTCAEEDRSLLTLFLDWSLSHLSFFLPLWQSSLVKKACCFSIFLFRIRVCSLDAFPSWSLILFQYVKGVLLSLFFSRWVFTYSIQCTVEKRCRGEPLGFQRWIKYCENLLFNRLNPFPVYRIDRLSVNEFIIIKKGFCSCKKGFL